MYLTKSFLTSTSAGYLAEVFFVCLGGTRRRTKQNNGEEAMNSDHAVQQKNPDPNWFSPFQSLLRYGVEHNLISY